MITFGQRFRFFTTRNGTIHIVVKVNNNTHIADFYPRSEYKSTCTHTNNWNTKYWWLTFIFSMFQVL